MRVMVAMMKHETNTFSPVPTDLARFARGQATPYYGDEAYKAFKGTNSGIGGFIDIVERENAELLIPIAASAWPSGRVHDEAYRHMCDHIVGAAAEGCDAILLDLHGAMVTESFEDGEGTLLERVRAAAPGVPIGVALDMHANMYEAVVANADVIAGYQTYPHVDHYETGVRAGRALLGMLRGEVNPTMAWGNRPMLPHVMRQSSEDFPNRDLQARCVEMEKDGVLAASLFTGFPHADIYGAGLSCVVVTDGDRALAERCRDELLDLAWSHREAFVYEVESLEDSLRRAADLEDGPIVLLDHYDNAASGGTMDTMTVIEGILAAGLEDVVAFAVHDPQAVQQMIEAGVGGHLTLALGGKLDMPAIGLTGEPLELTGRVRLISDGRYRNLGPAYTGVLMDMGPSVVFETGAMELVVISRHQEPNDLACFLSLGIDPSAKRYIMLKSRVHWRAGFGSLPKAIVECAGTGVCTSDYDSLEFNNLRRPIYPLDLINDPTPG